MPPIISVRTSPMPSTAFIAASGIVEMESLNQRTPFCVANSSSRCSSPLKSSTALIASSSGTPAVTAAVNATEMLYKLCFPIKVVFTRSRGTTFPQTYIFSPSIPHPFLSFANMTCCFAPSNIEMSMFSQVELTIRVSFSV